MTSFKGNLGNYKIIKTEDQTETIWSEYFDEACHNLSGAYQETIHNYILGCNIPELITQQMDFSVLDVGFGVGVGLLALLEEVKKYPCFKNKISYFSIELDEILLLWSIKTTLPFLEFTKCEKVNQNETLVFYKSNFGVVEINIFLGDGRKTLPMAYQLGLLPAFNAIFQDAFSPKKNPMLWSVEWFEFLKMASSSNVELSTYSSSVSIRKSLMCAGWSIYNLRGFALKKTMTKANFKTSTSEELKLELSRSPTLELRDK